MVHEFQHGVFTLAPNYIIRKLQGFIRLKSDVRAPHHHIYARISCPLGIPIGLYRSRRDTAYAQRARDAGIDVVMGGPHVTFEPDEALEFADYVVRGEGEDTMLELMDHLENGREAKDIAGVSRHDKGRSHGHNEPRPLRPPLT